MAHLHDEVEVLRSHGPSSQEYYDFLYPPSATKRLTRKVTRALDISRLTGFCKTRQSRIPASLDASAGLPNPPPPVPDRSITFLYRFEPYLSRALCGDTNKGYIKQYNDHVRAGKDISSLTYERARKKVQAGNGQAPVW
ncbi:Hypothetical protein D9617_10g075100 [Elsinoe fawcettii]|nr:Hypothetical protein D9617_10g075100 [Elsinoe fawcettii]